MMICQSALGRPFQVAHTKFISKEDLDQAGYHSVKGCGELAPDPAFDCEMYVTSCVHIILLLSSSEGVIVSLGKEAPTGVTRSELKHNEYRSISSESYSALDILCMMWPRFAFAICSN